jgi:hypothetical protein
MGGMTDVVTVKSRQRPVRGMADACADLNRTAEIVPHLLSAQGPASGRARMCRSLLRSSSAICFDCAKPRSIDRVFAIHDCCRPSRVSAGFAYHSL